MPDEDRSRQSDASQSPSTRSARSGNRRTGPSLLSHFDWALENKIYDAARPLSDSLTRNSNAKGRFARSNVLNSSYRSLDVVAASTLAAHNPSADIQNPRDNLRFATPD